MLPRGSDGTLKSIEKREKCYAFKLVSSVLVEPAQVEHEALYRNGRLEAESSKTDHSRC
jgi:hypothetical protein